MRHGSSSTKEKKNLSRADIRIPTLVRLFGQKNLFDRVIRGSFKACMFTTDVSSFENESPLLILRRI
uniref:Uncharacterized protein n=1 Tax=Ditylenchus dipsaci TaxID=166011 RepID=A0A915DD75_9BILA